MNKALQQSHIEVSHSAYRQKHKVKSESSSLILVCDFVFFLQKRRLLSHERELPH